MIEHRKIYKLDTKGKTRVWYMEQEGAQYRTLSGLLGGNLVISLWTTCEGKQGRSDEEQASFEVASAYENKLTREYHEDLGNISQGSHYFKPMLANEYKKWLGPCFSQPKLDGMRCIATKDGLFSRQGKPILSAPHIVETLAPAFSYMPDLVLDGEIYNHDLKDDFGQLMSLARKSEPADGHEVLQYHIYDIASHEGTFQQRIADLGHLIPLGDPVLKRVDTFFAETVEALDQFHAQCLELGYEGSMVRLDAPYEQKRSKNLLKRKEFKTEEFEIISIDEGIGNWSGVAKSVTCRLPDGRTFGAGIKGTKERAAQLLGETWAQATVRFFEYTPDGIPRFPVVIDFHNGRTD